LGGKSGDEKYPLEPFGRGGETTAREPPKAAKKGGKTYRTINSAIAKMKTR